MQTKNKKHTKSCYCPCLLTGVQHTLCTKNTRQLDEWTLNYIPKVPRHAGQRDDAMSRDCNTEASHRRASDRRLHSTTVDSTSVEDTTRHNRPNGLDHTRPAHNTTRSWHSTVSTLNTPESRHDTTPTRPRHGRIQTRHGPATTAGLYKMYTKYLLRRIAKML